MKLSNITLEIVKSYLRLDYDYEDELITLFMGSAKSYISKYTGLTYDQMDLIEDLNSAFLAITQHFYDNRGVSIESEKVNKIIDDIISLHSINLL